MSNFDYSQAKEMIKNVPDLSKTFSQLALNRSKKMVTGHKFAYLFFLANGAYAVSTLLSINIFGTSQDFVHQFRVRPDFITGKRVIAYNKQAKQLVLY